ncbi:hypothetical protein SETIT_7G317600v2 [Setaria italica]|uniref:RING-type domain-containing protein n=1 Tax=Setaria italica TaxID=4555 RepID=K3YDT7_SETIT|nr:uncharacterized protein LOC111257978 [Setaria italica]RCV36418.1 hypothetical protein SETIT_7G317600v2 [Setaria italica]
MASDDGYGDVSLMAAEEPHRADPELPQPASPPTEPMNTEEYLHALASYDRLAASVQGPNVAPPTEPTNLAGLVPMYRRLAAYLPSTLALAVPGPHGAPVTVDLNRLVYVWRAGERDGDGDVVGADDAYVHGGFGAVPASGDAMAALPETTVGEGEVPEECAVCLVGYEAGDKMRTMPCSHGFHEHCILGWLAVSRLCPLCRFALPAEVELDVEDEGSDDDDEADDDDVAC